MSRLTIVGSLVGFVAIAAARPPVLAPAVNPACALVTAAELERTMGGAVSGFRDAPAGVPGDPDVCNGTAGPLMIQLRLVPHATPEYFRAWKSLGDLTTQMGGKVETQADGPVTCRTMSPPAALAPTAGFSTSCTVTKAPKAAVIEIGSKSGLVPLAKVRPLALRMQERF